MTGIWTESAESPGATHPGLVGILLAAGESRRFGANKLLFPLHDGVPMAVVCARSMRAALPEVIAVVAHSDSAVARLLSDEGIRVVGNPRAREGMGTSIACGVAASPSARGWIIGLADMPSVPARIIRAVASRLEQGAGIAAPVYRGRRGHPVGFSARYATELMQLRGDAGARGILAAHRSSLVFIDVEAPGVIEDIDTPASVPVPPDIAGG